MEEYRPEAEAPEVDFVSLDKSFALLDNATVAPVEQWLGECGEDLESSKDAFVAVIGPVGPNLYIMINLEENREITKKTFH